MNFNDIFIAGVGEIKYGKHPDKDSIQLQEEVAIKACEDAGIEIGEIDGLITTGSRTQPYLLQHAGLAESMGISPKYSLTIQHGGAAHNTAIYLAANAVKGKMAEKVLVISADNPLTGITREQYISNLAKQGPPHPEFEASNGAFAPALFALIARKYMDAYGWDQKDLFYVAKMLRENAKLHPNAAMKKDLEYEDYENAKRIASPFKLLDCAPVVDGGGAFVVTNNDGVKNAKSNPVSILGYGECYDQAHITGRKDFLNFKIKPAFTNAIEMAGISQEDIDLAMIYDCFTIVLLIILEELNFAEKGKGLELLKRGYFDRDGDLPVNTHGGLLSHGHPAMAGGVSHIVEAVHQLRGTAGVRQVKEANYALTHGMGAAFSLHSCMILGK